MLFALAAAVVLQLAGPDTLDVYDTPATRVLVERAFAASAELPQELDDYRARVRSSLFLTLAPDSSPGGDLPATVDETVSEVRWSEQSFLHQRVLAHRTRVLIPLPYTLASILESPWVVPHLYGTTLETQSAFSPFAELPAIHPFGRRGPEFYRYAAGDTLRLILQGQRITVVPVEVRPRVDAGEADVRLLVGTFFLDADRGAIARARFGFAGAGGFVPGTLGRIETFLELENALWAGRYWLPYRQRRDVSFRSAVLGGTVTARTVSVFEDVELNTGWDPSGQRVVLRWALDEEPAARAALDRPVGEAANEFTAADFADLRVATSVDDLADEGVRLQLPHYARGEHLFRYNRVEGAFLGAGARLLPADPRDARWEVYATAGWAFAEGAARGELVGRWRQAAIPTPDRPYHWGAEAAAYRRLRDLRSFRPTYGWDWIYSVPALFAGSDWRDFYDATGVEAAAVARRGAWRGRLGARWEEHGRVDLNTDRFLFGEAEHFEPLALIRPGTHAALEGAVGYTRGPGAFGIGNSLSVQLEAQAGVADFDYQRVQALLSFRFDPGPVTLAARTDAGHVFGAAPPQKLFRFGGIEGLRGYDEGVFGGSTALLARSRLLLWLPPRGSQPLARSGFLLIPPLRPALALTGEAGRADVDDELLDELLLTGSVPTDGWRGTAGVGLSIFDDAFTAEYLWPVGEDDDRVEPRWYIGLTYWF